MNPSAGLRDRGSEFDAGEYDETYPPGYECHYWHRARGAIVRDLVRACSRQGDTVLDIGAGLGHYVRLLRDDGFDAYGCDLGNPRIHDEVKDFFFVNMDFASLEVGLRERVKTVLLLDVLEHIEKPSEFLASITRSLPAVRSIVIAVPARQEIWSNYDEHFRHFLRYDIDGLREVAREARLTVTAWKYFFHALYFPAWLMKQAGKNRRTGFVAPKARLLHEWLGRAFWLESKLIPGGVYGSSLACVCKPVEPE